jgi:hypothetical protein
MQDLPFFSSWSVCPVTGVGGGGDISMGDLEGVNSPCAISMDVRPSGFVGENQPPGKNREDVVDSILFRVVVGEGKSRREDEMSALPSSLRGARRNVVGLQQIMNALAGPKIIGLTWWGNSHWLRMTVELVLVLLRRQLAERERHLLLAKELLCGD